MSRFVRVGRAQLLVFVGIALVSLSLGLPWITASEPVLQLDGERTTELLGADALDGTIAAGGALVAGLLAVLDRRRRLTAGVAGLLGLFVAGLGLLYISDPLRGADYSSAEIAELVAPGIGLYLTLAGGLFIFGGAVESIRRSLSDTRPPDGTQVRWEAERATGPVPSRSTNEGQSDGWVWGVIGGVVLFVVTIVAFGTAENAGEAEENLLFLFILVSWILIPLSTYYDLKDVRARTTWQPRWWVWTLLTVPPFLNALTAPLYLYTRWLTLTGEHTSDDSQTEKSSRDE